MCWTEYLTSQVACWWGEVPNAPSKSWLPSITRVQWIVTTNYPLLLSPTNLAAVTTQWPTKAPVWIGSHWFGIFFHWVCVPMVSTMVSIRDAVWCLILTLFFLSFCCFAFSRLWPHVPTISHLAPTPTNNLPPWNKCWHAHSFTYYIFPNDLAT